MDSNNIGAGINDKVSIWLDFSFAPDYYIDDNVSFILIGVFIMPKVKDEYLAAKKDLILKCTEEILKEKPLYMVTMRDIINKAGFSQGVIYRYYANLSEIYVDLINKHTVGYILEQRIDTLLSSELPEKTILAECLTTIGEFIAELLRSAIGKTFFELLVLYSSEFEKRTAIFPQLKFRHSLEYAQNKTMEFTLSNIEKGVFRPQIPVRSIMLFVSIFFDGIAQNAVYGAAEGDVRGSEPAIDIPEMYQTLANAVINFL